MKVTLSVDSTESIEIGYSDLALIVSWLDDEPRNLAFLSVLAAHPASEVRCAAAGKSCLPAELLGKLALDESIEVVRGVACNETALRLFDQHQFQAMIERDVSVASDLANNLSMVNETSLDSLILSLLKHPDPKVADAVDFESNRWAD